MSRRHAARLLLLAAAALAPERARADCTQAFERDGFVYYEAAGAVRRFELATGEFASPVPLDESLPFYRLAADAGVFWVQRFASIDGLDLAGNVVRQIPVDYEVVDVDAADGHVFVLGMTDLHSYDAATGALEDSIPVPPIQYGGLVTVPGSRVVLHAGLWMQTVAYAADGELGAIVPVYAQGTFATQRLERSAGGRLIADGAFFDATTLRLVEGYGGELAVAVGAELVTLDETGQPFPPFVAYTPIRRYDAARNLVGMELIQSAIGPPYHAFFSDGSAVWALDCNGAVDGTGRFDRIELDDIAAPVLPAPIPQAGFEDGIQFGLETGDEGVLYFLALNGEHQVRRWLPGEDRFLESLPLAEQPLGLSRAAGGGVFVHYAYGRTTRLAPDGTESPVPRFPSDGGGLRPLLEGSPWWILNGAGRVHVFAADGTWLGVHRDVLGSNHAVWDAPRSRIIRINGATSFAGALDVAPDGSITPGPEGPVEIPYPLVGSGGDRIFARDRIVDAETLAVVAVLPRLVTGAERALWHGPDRLLTLSYGNFELTVYSEYTADGEASGPAVVLPGLPEAILALGERALLVRRIAGEFVFTVVTPGGDLDSDGTTDAADDFPIDPAEHSDRDGDGVGDNADPFPDDPNESSDMDGDGLGDGTDYLPGVAAVRVAAVSGDDWLGIVGIGRSGQPVAGQVHLLANGGFAFCIGLQNCLAGTWREVVAGRKVDALLAPEPLVAFGEAIAMDLERTFDRGVSFRFLTKRARAKVRTDPDGTVRLAVRVPHRVKISRAGLFTGAYRIRAKGTWIELTPPSP